MSGPRLAEFKKITAIDKAFWALVEKGPGPNDCWIWKGKVINRKGMRSTWFYLKSYSAAANRYAWQSCYNKILSTRTLLRDCSNELCVRPDHYTVLQSGGNHHTRRISSDAHKALLKERGIVAVHTPAELQAPVAPPVDLSPVLKELEAHRTALTRILRFQDVLSASLTSLTASVESLMQTRELDSSVSTTKLLDAIRSLQPTQVAQTASEAKPTTIPDPMDAIIDSFEFGYPVPVTPDDIENLRQLRDIAFDRSLTHEQNHARVLQWIETFHKLATSRVFPYSSHDLLQAARGGWLQSGREPA